MSQRRRSWRSGPPLVGVGCASPTGDEQELSHHELLAPSYSPLVGLHHRVNLQLAEVRGEGHHPAGGREGGTSEKGRGGNVTFEYRQGQLAEAGGEGHDPARTDKHQIFVDPAWS